MCLSPFGVIVAAVAAVALAAFVIALVVATATVPTFDIGLIFECCVCRRLASLSPLAATHTGRLQVGWYIIIMALDRGGGEVVE